MGLFDDLIAKGRGKYGEYKTSGELYYVSDYKKVLRNVYIPTTKGNTTEIDILLLHESGIYIIENKNYSGWIFGNEQNQKWTQCMYGKKNSFYNPIKQNNTHIKYLQLHLKELNINPEKFNSIVVFNKSATLKDITTTSNVLIFKQDEFETYILKVLNKKEKVLNREIIDKIASLLVTNVNVSSQVKKDHVNSIKEIIK